MPTLQRYAELYSEHGGHSQLTFWQAFQELTKGEQTAAALENHLTAVEAKIEALLAQVDRDQDGINGLKAEQNSKAERSIEDTQEKEGQQRETS